MRKICNFFKPSRRSEAGFSLVELMVALLFTAILMAGLATVFKASIGTFTTSSEAISSSRRNRMALNLLSDDLDHAGMFLDDLQSYTNAITTTNPALLVVPNQVITGTDLEVPKADQLIMYFDDPLPFYGQLGSAIQSAGMVNASGGAAPEENTNPTLNFASADQVNQLTALGASTLKLRFLGAAARCYTVDAVTKLGALGAKLTLSQAPDASGRVGSDTYSARPPFGTNVMVFRPGRYVRYSIQSRGLDPENPGNLIPCLIREDVTYGDVASSSEPFKSPDTSVIVAENVSKFVVFFSANGGKSWVGGKTENTAWSDLATQLDAEDQLATFGRPGYTSTSFPFWFRENPILVRVDLTTRTAHSRTEYGTTDPNNPIAKYREQTQSLIMMPRHSGLAFK